MFWACFGKLGMPKRHEDQPSNLTRFRRKPTCGSEPISTSTGCPHRSCVAATTTRVELQASGLATEGSGASSRPAQTGLNASRLKELDPENVVICDASRIMEGLRLRQRELGRGTYGIVASGTYRGVNCAVKIMLSTGLDKAALRELLLGPSLVHPHIVPTFTTRAAHLTHAFFDLLEGRSVAGRDRSCPRMLEPVPIQSGDGFGDPQGLDEGLEPLLLLHQILHALNAETGKMVIIVVQEYCDRGTLDNAIRKCVFAPDAVWGLRVVRRALLRTAGEVARGLLHLHHMGIVHGDIKPANILLQSSREDRRGFMAKLGDFGLAHVLPDAVTSLVTKTWGSVAYMAPEAFSGKVSRATDVWAFGVCLWQMLTGTLPYRGISQDDVITGLQNHTLALSWPDTAPMAAPIIALGRRCLSYDPEGRPTLEEVVEELVAFERQIRAELLGGAQSATSAQGEAGARTDAKVEDDFTVGLVER